MQPYRINHLAILLLVIIHQAIGALWYSPLLFADAWMIYLGKTINDFSSSNPVPYIISILSSLVLCYTMAWLFRHLQVNTAVRGLMIAIMCWFGFLFLESATMYTFSLRPFGLLFIDLGRCFFTFAVAGLMLGGWRKPASTMV